MGKLTVTTETPIGTPAMARTIHVLTHRQVEALRYGAKGEPVGTYIGGKPILVRTTSLVEG